jgi:hypothetical protein
MLCSIVLMNQIFRTVCLNSLVDYDIRSLPLPVLDDATPSGLRRRENPILIASSDKIKSELGWQPEFQDLRLIIQSAWDWLAAHPQGYDQ